MNESTATYRSYVLRLWQNSSTAQWHASMQHVQTSEIIHFSDMLALVAFLYEQTETVLSTSPSNMPKEDHAIN